MLVRKRHLRLLYLPVFTALVFTGCFSLPFIKFGGGGEKEDELLDSEFDRINVFVGYDKKDQPIVEMRLLSQEVDKNGLVIETRIFPTENFRVRNQFRGLRSINYYPIERRFHRLELRFGRKRIKAKVRENIQVRGTKPFEAAFEHTGIHYLLPDTINMVKLKFQDVKRWGRLPPDTLDAWYAAKAEFLEEVRQQTRRQNLLKGYQQRQREDRTETFSQYDSLYVTANNTYVYLEKAVASDILHTLNTGDRIDFGISDGTWVEFPLPDSLVEGLSEMLDLRRERAIARFEEQRQRQRSSRSASTAREAPIDTARSTTAYLLDVMVARNFSDAMDWERQNMRVPVDVPLFKQVLLDRVAAAQARKDSIEQARIDSIQVYADSIAMIDSLRADSLARADSILRADSLVQAESVQPELKSAPADTAATVKADISSAKPPPARVDSAGADTAAVKKPPAGADTSSAKPPPARVDSAGADTAAVKKPPAGADTSSAEPPPTRVDSAGADKPPPETAEP
ncbi:MAG: hypothetical protein U9P14_05780 [Gemmatimonadota bacterium]|nr:hypothetical protein [Gemmatimonadota bacterium]